MGTQVTSPSIEATKPSHTVATVLGSLPPAIAAGQAAIWIGNTLDARQTEIHARIQQLIDAAREFDFSSPAGQEKTYEVLISGHKGDVTSSGGAAIPVLTEDQVAIMWDTGFAAPGSNGLFVTAFERMRETLMELKLKVS